MSTRPTHAHTPHPGAFTAQKLPRRALLAVAASLAATSLPAWAQATLTTPGGTALGLPVAAVKNVVDTHHGVKVDDPYRYFEDIKNPEVAAWMRAHSDHAHATLGRIAGRAKVLADIERFDNAAASRVVGVARSVGDKLFFQRRGATENQFKLYMRASATAADELLVNPEALEALTRQPHAINYFNASPNGRLVAYGMSQGGSEDAVLHILDTKTGRGIGEPIELAQFGGVDWASNSASLVFNRLQTMKDGMPGTEKFQRSQVLHLQVGQSVASAKTVFGMDTPGVKMSPAEIPFVSLTGDGKWALGVTINGTQREQGMYIAPQAQALAGTAKWVQLIGYADEITGFSYAGGMLYLKTHKGATRSKVLALDMNTPNPSLAQARVVVPASERVVTNIASGSDALYIEARDGNIKRLYKRAHTADAPTVEVKLPIEGAFELSSDEGASGADTRLPGVVIELQSWTRARQIYLVSADGTVANTNLQPQGPFDAPDDVVATEVKVRSHDGAVVPMSIIHKRGVKLDGNNPTILYGYASYGVTEEPFFSNGRLAWMAQGGVFAVANPRGSSVYGQDWYKAGFQTTKPNTWKDFIACAEYLIAQKYTKPARLGILGGSAGGILVGRAMTERPDLFAAVIPAVGALDNIRMESTPNGVPNIPEFGSVKDEAGFKALLAMSTYAQTKTGAAYPAVLLTHGVNDPRVEVWESTKAAARLMAATSSKRPVLLRLDYDAGHGIGNTKKQQHEERADMYSFFLWQMGVAGFEAKGNLSLKF